MLGLRGLAESYNDAISELIKFYSPEEVTKRAKKKFLTGELEEQNYLSFQLSTQDKLYLLCIYFSSKELYGFSLNIPRIDCNVGFCITEDYISLDDLNLVLKSHIRKTMNTYNVLYEFGNLIVSSYTLDNENYFTGVCNSQIVFMFYMDDNTQIDVLNLENGYISLIYNGWLYNLAIRDYCMYKVRRLMQ